MTLNGTKVNFYLCLHILLISFYLFIYLFKFRGLRCVFAHTPNKKHGAHLLLENTSIKNENWRMKQTKQNKNVRDQHAVESKIHDKRSAARIVKLLHPTRIRFKINLFKQSKSPKYWDPYIFIGSCMQLHFVYIKIKVFLSCNKPKYFQIYFMIFCCNNELTANAQFHWSCRANQKHGSAWKRLSLFIQCTDFSCSYQTWKLNCSVSTSEISSFLFSVAWVLSIVFMS